MKKVNQIFLLKTLIVSSILLLMGIFFSAIYGSYKIMGFAFLQYIIVIYLNVSMLLKRSDVNTERFAAHISKEIDNSLETKKYVRSGVYASIIPAMSVGILFILISILLMIFVF